MRPSRSARLPWAALAAASLLVAGLGAGCGAETDDRPADFKYVVVTVLRPACGTAACHSSLTRTAGLAFDTVEAARETFQDEHELVRPGDPARSKLIEVMIGDEEERMPPDGPVPDRDVDLLVRWIEAGAVMN